MRLYTATAWIVLVLAVAVSAQGTPFRWVCYYAASATPSELSRYDLLVFDSDAHPPIPPLQQRGKVVIGYLSIGEVNKTRDYFGAVQSEKLVLGENKNWKDSFFVDVRNPLWTRRVVEQLIPKILKSGFNGVFLDTVDNAAYLEEQDPVRNKGMADAMVRLIHTIRQTYPKIRVVVNRGFDILPRVESDIDMVLGESIVPSQVTLLKELHKRRPSITILTLDYVNPTDVKSITETYPRRRQLRRHSKLSHLLRR